MGISNDMPTPDEESLPLYSNLEYDDANTDAPPTLPEATATPDVVREFLVRLLVSQRKLSLDHARRIAARWNMGSGRELWIYSPAMYNTIFGAEDGWVLYKDVRVLHSQTQNARKGFWRRHALRIWLAVSLVWLAIQGIMIALGPDLETEFQIATAMFGTLFGVLSLLFSITMVLVQKNLDPAKVAEAQLRQSFFSNNNIPGNLSN